MAPDYSKLAGILKKEGSAVKICKLDATVEKDIATKYDVKGFPTLKLFINGLPIDYKE